MSPKVDIAWVVPVVSPYVTDRIIALSRILHTKRVQLVVENEALSHRPGWLASRTKGIEIVVLKSLTMPNVYLNRKLGFRVTGLRSLPISLLPYILKNRPKHMVFCNATQLMFAIPLTSIFGIRTTLIVEDTIHSIEGVGTIRRFIKGLLYRCAGSRVAMSNDARQFLQRYVPGPTIESRWSLDMQNRRQSIDTATKLRKSVLFVGALVERKGVDLLIKAWAGLPSSVRDTFNLRIAGTGPLQEYLESFVLEQDLQDSVRMLGQISTDNVSKEYQGAALYVLPTRQDLFSLTVLEALSYGCPVITTRYNGAAELVAEGTNGWVLQSLTADALGEAILRALNEPKQLDQMRSNAKGSVSHLDNIQVMTELTRHLFN